MSLFQKSVLNKYLKTLDDAKVQNAYEKYFAFFQNETIIQNIRDDKEEQFQYGFLQALFDNVLDYTINPNEYYNLTTEFKNLRGAKKADGAILKDGKAIGVIELKSTKTKDLVSITEQAFGYKNNHRACDYIITSNFEKLRFFIGDAVEYIDFDLFTLSIEQFKLLYLCLQKDQILSGVPLKIKLESTIQEEEITKKLYKDYSAFKKTLFNDMVLNNPDIDKMVLFEKSQKLLDRFLFIFFAEDKGLLPPNSISEILKKYELLIAEDFEKPLFEIFKQYFGYINKGRDKKGNKAEIFGYNGGLFKPDEILDTITISDAALIDHAKTLTAYDFESEVDVNILGHIFEHSLNEIDAMAAELSGETIDKSKTKRKKDGVFYTPKYITKYIVDNTLGKLATEKKEELGIQESEFTSNRKKSTKKRLLEDLEAYRAYLLTLTICDPACGSGAFLNQALDCLINEHRYIDELQTKLLGGSIVLSDITNDILENNIFGVDINAESVNIAQLSLWLRTAQKGRALTTLNDNIKCGNSLIEDEEVAGAKAFNWENEFPEVFANGGFDIIIGNPPYVRPRGFQDKEKSFIIEQYQSAENQFDLYHIFIEKSELLRNSNGIVSMILPNAFLANENSQLLRKYILENCHINKIIDCKQEVFKDASVDVLIYVFDNSSEISHYYELSNNVFEFKHLFQSKKFIKNKNINFTPTLNIEAMEVFQKIKNNTKELGEYFNVMSGIKEYQTGKGKPKQVPEDKLERRFNASYKKDDTYVKEVRGRHVQRYSLEWENEFVSYGMWLAEPRNPIYFEGDRFLVRQIPAKDSLIACHTNKYYIVDQSAYVVKPKNEDVFNKGIIGVLNSKLIFWFYRNENNEFDNLFPKIKAKEIKALPLVDNDLRILDGHVIIIENTTKQLQICQNTFIKYIKSQISIEKLSKKLQNWHLLEFGDFIKELNKAIKKIGDEKLSKMDEMEWMEVFEAKKAEAKILKIEIDKIDKEIDTMVYALYNLTDDEIAIVEAVN